MPIQTSNIAQMAAQFLELNAISSLADENDVVRDLALFYPQAMDTILEAGDYSFASSNAALNQISDETALDSDLPYAFGLPDKFLRLQDIRPRGTRFRVDGRILWADTQTGLVIRFTRHMDRETDMSARAREAIALQLAVYMAPRWLESRTKTNDLLARLDNAQTEARRLDARSASPRHIDGGYPSRSWAEDAVL